MSRGTALRLAWGDLPSDARMAFKNALGSDVIDEVSQVGGFSPGLASRLRLADGRRVFAKAISADRNPAAPGLFRREAAIMPELPAEVPAPTLLWSYDDGDWVMLVLEDIDGQMPSQPWDPAQLAKVVTSMAAIAEVRVHTGSPIPSADDLADNFRSWEKLTETAAMAAELGPWEQANLDWLTHLADMAVEAASGDTLAHTDLRADNMLITGTRVVFVDWPYALAAAAWLDMLLFLPSAAVGGNVDPAELWASFPAAQKADAEAVNAVLAAAAGDWTYQSLLPAPANLPALRDHQRQKAQAAMKWLRSRID